MKVFVSAARHSLDDYLMITFSVLLKNMFIYTLFVYNLWIDDIAERLPIWAANNSLPPPPPQPPSPSPLPIPHSPLPTPDHARTHFRDIGVFFSMGGANSRNQEKEVNLQAWVREILKMGQIWHVFITICLFHMFE